MGSVRFASCAGVGSVRFASCAGVGSVRFASCAEWAQRDLRAVSQCPRQDEIDGYPWKIDAYPTKIPTKGFKYIA